MITFFTIFFILFGINVAMMVFSLNSVKQNAKKSSPKVTDSEASKIYPVDLIPSKFKKAV